MGVGAGASLWRRARLQGLGFAAVGTTAGGAGGGAGGAVLRPRRRGAEVLRLRAGGAVVFGAEAAAEATSSAPRLRHKWPLQRSVVLRNVSVAGRRPERPATVGNGANGIESLQWMRGMHAASAPGLRRDSRLGGLVARRHLQCGEARPHLHVTHLHMHSSNKQDEKLAKQMLKCMFVRMPRNGAAGNGACD